MTLNNIFKRSDSPANPRSGPGWTGLHSWVFLAIVAVGFAVILVENRWFYLSPLGLGKAYRIDKLFGGIQEFEPGKGWIIAKFEPMSQMPDSMPGPLPPGGMPPGMPPGGPGDVMRPSAMAPPTAIMPPTAAGPPMGPAGPPSIPMAEEKKQPPSVVSDSRPMAVAQPPEPQPAPAAQPVPQPAAAEKPKLSRDDRLKVFLKTFPEYGEEEFQLANDDLYPDWVKKVGPAGSWEDFLKVYQQFVQWWVDSGSPAESGSKLWQNFMASQGR